MDRPKTVDVALDLKIIKISGKWEPSNVERKAAWELYVELVTRIGVVPLDNGILRESLNSLHSIFGSSREILRRYGPEVAEPGSDGGFSFGYLSVAVLNFTLRPFLSYWHPELSSWEDTRPTGASAVEHQAAWSRSGELRSEIETVRISLTNFSALLARVCGVPDLLHAVPVRYDPNIGVS